jgi:NADPH-dependent 2,4-dienoyl-CoA reductase/sulfur reductase-like enzyme
VSIDPGLVVVGASVAGVRTVEALRRRGYDARITVLGAEPHVPYDRPPLSKEFLLGKIDVADLALSDAGAFGGLDVELRLSTAATGADLERKHVLVAGDRVPYSTLVVATGSTPRLLPGTEHLAGVYALRTLDDAAAIRNACSSAARVAVVGGGFIGVEVASSARLLGLQVTIIDPLPALMIRGLGAEVGAALARRHADNGADVRLGRGVAEVRGQDRVEQLVLDDGSVVDADVVVVGIGVTPALGWLAGSGLDVSAGLGCDATLRVTDSVYAVGDVASWTSGTRRRRLEHWTNAVDQAAALASVLTGNPTAYDPLPYVWSDQLGSRLQVWGEILPGDEVVFVSGDADEGEFVAAAGRDGRLAAVAAFGARRDAMRAMRLLRAGAAWERGKGPVEPAE